MDQTLIEHSVLSVLAIAMIALLYLSVDRFSNFKFVSGQLEKFKNKTELELELNKKMMLIYSISSNAVYIGLLGTVLGVMLTLSQIGSADQAGIIAALSLPLMSTAVSIVVAIVGTFLYNSLLGEIENVKMRWDICHGHSAQSREHKNVASVVDPAIDEGVF